MYTSVLGIQLTDVFKPAITGSEEIQGSYVANFWKYEKTARETAVRDKDKLPLVCTDTSTVGTVEYRLEDEEKPPVNWIGGPLSSDTSNWNPFLVMTATPQRVSVKEEKNQCVYDENKEINWHETLVNFLEASFAWRYSIRHRKICLINLVAENAAHLRDGLEDMDFEDIVQSLNNLTKVLTPHQIRLNKLWNYKRLANQPIQTAMATVLRLYSALQLGPETKVSLDPDDSTYNGGIANYMKRALYFMVDSDIQGYVSDLYDQAAAQNRKVYLNQIIKAVARYETTQNKIPQKDIPLYADKKKTSKNSIVGVNLNSVSVNNLKAVQADIEDSDSDEDLKTKKKKRVATAKATNRLTNNHNPFVIPKMDPPDSPPVSILSVQLPEVPRPNTSTPNNEYIDDTLQDQHLSAISGISSIPNFTPQIKNEKTPTVPDLQDIQNVLNPLVEQLNLSSANSSTISNPGDKTTAISSSSNSPTPSRGSTVSNTSCLLYTSPSPRDGLLSRMPSSA